MKYRSLLIVLLSIFLCACGFHLQNNWTVSPQYRCLYLTTPSPYSNFTRQLRISLEQNQVQLLDRPTPNSSRLHISVIDFGHDSPTIGTSNMARVFRYTLIVQYQIDDAPPQKVLASRFTTLNAGILTTTNNQIYLVEQGLIDDVILQLLNMLSSPNAASADHNPIGSSTR